MKMNGKKGLYVLQLVHCSNNAYVKCYVLTFHASNMETLSTTQSLQLTPHEFIGHNLRHGSVFAWKRN